METIYPNRGWIETSKIKNGRLEVGGWVSLEKNKLNGIDVSSVGVVSIAADTGKTEVCADRSGSFCPTCPTPCPIQFGKKTAS